MHDADISETPGRVLIDVRPPAPEDGVMSLHSETPGHGAILYMRMEPGPAEHLNLADRPAATFVYRPDAIASRDSLRALLPAAAGRIGR